MSGWNVNTHYYRAVLDRLPVQTGVALDVGCGDGVLSWQLAEQGWRVVALDRDAHVLHRARQARPHRRITWTEGDFFTEPFADESFDAVVGVASLHHMDAAAGLQRMAGLIRPGGTIVQVGLAANDWWDWPYALLGSLAARVGKLLHRKQFWEHTAPTSWPPPLTYREVKRVAKAVLPGCSFRRGLLGRLVICWAKPDRTGQETAPGDRSR